MFFLEVEYFDMVSLFCVLTSWIRIRISPSDPDPHKWYMSPDQGRRRMEMQSRIRIRTNVMGLRNSASVLGTFSFFMVGKNANNPPMAQKKCQTLDINN